jgi:hypothetical protein
MPGPRQTDFALEAEIRATSVQALACSPADSLINPGRDAARGLLRLLRSHHGRHYEPHDGGLCANPAM